MTRPRVYAAHPIVTYGSARERDCIAALHALLPEAEVYNPAGRYSTAEEWRSAWPRVLTTLSGLVIFGTRAGVVGMGCLREIGDAHLAGLPIAMLDRGCRTRTYAGIGLPPRAATPRRVAVLIPGEPVDLREVLGLPPAKDAT
ncbi:MAG: hypothetical protein ACLQK4_02425 [Acidimicrobiales bacterium]